MNTLKDFQRDFVDALLVSESNKIDKYLAPNSVSNAGLFSIYVRNMYGGLKKVLEDCYPTIVRLVGDEFFTGLAYEFVKQHPPVSGNLDDYGKDFSLFLDQFPPAQKLPYLADMARFEWAQHQSLLADPSSNLEPDCLKGLSPQEMAGITFTPHTSLHIISSCYPLLRIWQIDEDDNEQINLDEGGDDILIIRNNNQLQCIPLDKAELLFLESLLEGNSLAQAYEDASEKDSDFDLAFYVNKHIVCGCFSNMNVA